MTISSRPNWTLALGLPLLVIIACVFIAHSPLYALHAPRMSTAIVLDLTVTAPLLYFLAIRKTGVSKMTVIRVFVVGVLVAGRRRQPSPDVELQLALFRALEGHSVRVRLRQPVTVTRMFGIRRQASILFFAADRPEELVAAVRGK